MNLIRKYKITLLTKPKKIEIKTAKVPRLKPLEVLIRPLLAGICGTDIAIFNGYYKVPLPITLGHEFIGKIEEIGSNVNPRLKGKIVTSEINFTCLKPKSICPACKRGLSTHCQRRTVLGIENQPGAFAEAVVTQVGNIHLIPKNLSQEASIFIEPLAAAIQTFEMTPIAKGDVIAVLGLGRLGILEAIVAKAYGARVIVISREEKRLEQALGFGIKETILSKGLPLTKIKQKILSLTNGLGADMVIEATGSPSGIKEALELVRPRGTIAVKTTCGLPVDGLDTTKIVVNEIKIQGSRCGPFDKAIDFLVKHKPDLPSLITRYYTLEETSEALKKASKHSPKIEKIVIKIL